jgi:DNA-binding protein HU-beta
MSLSKPELIAAIARATGVSQRAAASAFEAFFSSITKALKKDGSVTLTGFGTFRVRRRAARMGSNPRNPSEKISIPARKVPVFKAGAVLKAAVR